MKGECISFRAWDWFSGLMDHGTDSGLAEDGFSGRASQSPPPEHRCQAFADDLEALRRGELPIDALRKRYAAASDADFG